MDNKELKYESQEEHLINGGFEREVEYGNINDKKLEYWIIKLGKLFYTGGLPRLLKGNDNIEGYDFSNNEDVSFPIMFEESAKNIASKVGGIAIKRKGTVKSVGILQENNDSYKKSGELWHKQQLESFKE